MVWDVLNSSQKKNGATAPFSSIAKVRITFPGSYGILPIEFDFLRRIF